MRRTATPASLAYFLLLLLSIVTALPREGWAQVSQGQVADSTELRVLHQFYQATNGARWATRTNWPASEPWATTLTSADFATWYGVNVTNGDVTGLSLVSNNLTGPLPANLSQLSQLSVLRLDQNNLSGTIPAAFGQLTQLTYLSLGVNRLYGAIPASLGQLHQLYNLALNSNGFSGNIPVELAQLQQLRYLTLYHTLLSGAIPAELGQLSQLTNLELSGNQFSGAIPAELGQLTTLQNLTLGGNQLTGAIPASFGQLAQLQYMGLQSNQLSGAMPDELGQLSNLRRLDVSSNQLSGPIPASFGQLRNLQELSLYRNQLQGAIPATLGQLLGLQTLNLSANQLSGPIPASLGNLTGLTDLELYNNQLTGAIPAELGQMSSLLYIELYKNLLTSSIPASLGNIPYILELNLANNRLSGSIPAALGTPKQLYYLYLNDNQLSGAIPTELGRIKRSVLSLNNNQLTGTLPVALCTTPNLALGASNNQLTGIPDLAGATSITTQLSLTGNNLGFADLERLYQGVNSPRYRTLTILNQRPSTRTDTLSYQLGQPLMLKTAVTALTYRYQWQRLVSGQWVDMPGDTLATKTWSVATASQQGTYRLMLGDRWFTNASLGPTRLYSAMVYADLTPYPALARNLPVDGNGVAPLQQPLLAPDAHAATLAPDLNYVRVWTPRVALTEAATAPTRPPGLRREEWAGVRSGGTAAIPLTTTPTLVQQLPSLEATSTTRFQYGARLRGWLVPPVTGTYTLYLSASYRGRLYLSPDADPAHRVLLDTCSQYTNGAHDYQRYPGQAAQVTLQAGQAYYLEVLHRHDYGPGYASVGWQLPGGSVPTQPIPGQYLRPYVPGEGGADAVTWSVAQAAMSTQYLDGLGRPVQTVQWQASPSKHDLVQVQQYDGLGREPRQYLPYVADSTSGGYRPRGLAEQGRYYGQLPPTGPPSPQDLTQGVARTGVAFAETMFEASPLNRVLAQAAPGENWQLTGGHHLERQERPNVFADSVLRFQPGYDPQDLDPRCQGSYAPGELWGTFTRDEHGFWSAEWKDKLGQVVSKQVQTPAPGQGAGAPRRWLRTLYVYDDFQRLRFVLQPEASRRQLAAVAALAPAPPPQGVRLQRWNGVAGTSLADIPLSQPPTSTQVLGQLEAGDASGSDLQYGARLQAWLLPPQDGTYTFYLTGDDVAALYLSTDADPAHQVLLATSPSYTNGARDYGRATTAPVSLRSDRVYYLQVLHKQQWGSAYASVSWQLPDGTPTPPTQPISGSYLVPYAETQAPPPAPGSIPLPVASLPAAATPFVFHYRYDGRGRQIAKQVPGQDGETLIVYDQLDRPVLSQDAQQRTRQEWSWTKYDALGRVVLTGLVTRPDTLSQVSLQNMAAADTTTSHQYEQRTADKTTYPQFYTTRQAFPRLGAVGQQGFGEGVVLTASYYDDYDFDNNGQPDAQYDPSQDAQFASGQAPVADALRTTGLATRTSTRVLGVAESDQQQAAWLSTTSFYDERGRIVQLQSTNARKGTDLVTSQLDFTGKVVQSVATHQTPSLGAQALVVKESFAYDHTGRVLANFQQLPSEAQPVLLDSLHYNELGQVTRKTLGTGRLRQDVDYAYNIRGWLTSLNNPYAPDPKDLFNLSLHYEQGFTPGYEQYNGNLTGQTWRGHDGVQRAQGYVYDPLNRILQGDFVARTVGASPSQGAWTQELDNYRLSFVSYDDNGNILSLRRRGLLQAATSRVAKQYGAVDNLSYSYQGNRLQAVNDLVSGNQLPQPAGYHGAPTSLAGDFQEGGVQQAQEYGYDANGNLTSDRNKGITGIGYNHLNLPRQLHFGQEADSVVFRYTASGQKVAKLVYQTGKPVRRTDYLGPYQYEGDSLRFFPQAEGRVLRFVSGLTGAVSYQREYTLKDHLGNLRLAYRLGQVRTLTATLEQDAATHKRESQQFDSLSVSPPVAQPVGGLARSGTYAARLNAGGSTPQPLGPLTQLGVQRGDTVTVQAYGYYAQPAQHGFFFSLASFVANLFHPASPPPPGLEAQRRLGFPLLQVGVAAGLASIPQLDKGVPKGYLRLVVFTRDSVLAPTQPAPVQLTQAASGGYEPLRLQLVLPQDGYVSAYVGNESDVDVLFDDVVVVHRPGLQVQETQYDPAGLELAGLAPPSPGIKGLNNYRFNGKEFQADLGLAWNHQDWRFLDPTILHWNGVDPEVENGQESWTPYSFGFDNAVRYADADGRCPCEGDPPITVAGIIKSTFYGLAASVANTALALADYRSPEGIIGMLSGQSYRATVGADGISYDKRPAVTSERQAAGYIGADALDMASAALTVATMGEGAAVGRVLPMATGLLLEQGAGKVAQNEIVQEGKSALKTYQTYTMAHPDGGKPYIGRTSGTGTPEQNLARRANAGHEMLDAGYGRPKLDRTSSNSKAIRGREQQLIDKLGGSKSSGGTSSNKDNGISPRNKQREIYLKEATKEFGNP